MTGETLPITQYILKVHSRCNLACDYCYVYEHADQSWRSKPAAMSVATASSVAARIAEHAASHQIGKVRVILHGGEPLLLGRARMRAVLTALDSQISSATALDLRAQTNGVLLDQRWCDLFAEFGLRIGVSLDGDQIANDRHRRSAAGQSSHHHVRRALALLRQPQNHDLYAGILCTIDLANDPIGVYEALIAEEPPNLDLLLPHATWDNPPLRPPGQPDPYAAWLLRVYRRWMRDGRPVPIRLFDSLLSAAGGGPSGSEAVGLDPVDLLVADSDGSWERSDSLKTAYDGAPETGLHVSINSIDDVANLPVMAAYRGGLAGLCATCRNCAVVHICGAGLYAHRYAKANGFDNPTVYCPDMKALISHMTSHRSAGRRAGGADAAHALPDGAFDALAAGPGNVAAIRSLAQMRLSATRALVAAVACADSNWRDEDLKQAAAEGWQLLCELDAQHPRAVREIFCHPYTHAWAVSCLRPSADADIDLDRAHIAGMAVAAALRAGVSVRLPVPIRNGRLFVPTLGALRIDGGPRRTATISATSGALAADGQTGAWQRARMLHTGSARIALEDLDPFRDCQRWPAAGRATIAQSRAWRQAMADSAARLARDLPEYGAALAAGLRAIVPLRPGGSGDRSATARQAFGAVAVALPRQPGHLDALLLHEFQHVKLHALVDLHDLFDADDRRRFLVPWRTDPRPVEGVLHGAYAHLALAHLARSRRTAGSDRYGWWVRQAAEDLLEAGVLTEQGQRFVTSMRSAAEERRADG